MSAHDEQGEYGRVGAVRRPLSAAVPLLIAMLLAAAGYWYFFTAKSLRFREQVQLADGQVIEVSRFVRAKPYRAIGGGGWDPVQQSLRIHENGVPAPTDPPEWRSDIGLAPILVEKDAFTGQWLVVATFVTCEGWYMLGKPTLPYAQYRPADGGWTQVPLSPHLMGRASNITSSIRYDGEEDLVTLADKAQRLRQPRIPVKYLRIVDQWSSGC